MIMTFTGEDTELVYDFQKFTRMVVEVGGTPRMAV